jgi:hypothetical protein
MATFSTKAITALKALTKPHLLLQSKKHIFIISHMRARTTLLSHILNTSNEIVGSNELHVRYRNAFDELKARTMRIHDHGFYESSYICDKLLHNRLEINLDRYRNAKYIFNLRPVEDTFKSLLLRHLQHQPASSVHKLQEYYIKRLIYMKELWEALPPENRIYINSDDVIDDTQKSLIKLQEFLSLLEPLSEEYSIDKNTGTSGHGDMSTNITEGKVIKTAPSLLTENEEKLLNQICTKSEFELFDELEALFNTGV